MSAILKLFGSVALPEYDFSNPATGSGPTASTATRTAGGGYFDALGSARAPLELPYTLPFRGTLAEDTTAAFAARMKELRGMRGKVANLLRELEDGTTQWCEAKCVRVPAEGAAGQALTQEVEIEFEIRSPWYGALHGAAWYLGQSGIFLGDGHVLGHVESHELTASPTVITLTNAGEGQVRAVRITVFAGDGTMTALRLACGDCEWDFTETIAAVKSLIVDTGAWTVQNDGVDAWNGLQVTANHTRGEWLLLEPGANVVTVTFTSNASAVKPRIRFDFSDAHE